MSENKHYGRQILLSLFLTVFILLVLLYVASRYLLPLYSINQEQIYDVLVKLFPLLIGMIMIEIGVLVARKRDEDLSDEIDKLPPNAYDKPLYTLPGDDPLHRHSDEMVFSQSLADEYKNTAITLAPEDELVKSSPKIREVLQPTLSKVEQVEDTQAFDAQQTAPTISESREVETEKASLEEKVSVASTPLGVDERTRVVDTYINDFSTILSTELENAQDMDYDLTLVLIDVTKGPAEQIANKMIMLSGELAYSFTLTNNRLAMVLPFYNADEARSFTLSLLESCKKEFSGASLQIGFASRNGRVLDSSLLLHEAVAACTLEDDENEEDETD
ncbi:MAG: hypothetical protein JEY71_00180 [Sphaerochaeta sp.]|nr:hypothetical protein [Sphaerochaeta sp.]